MASKCIFCRIAAKELPAKFVFEDDDVMAFQDLNPQAPVHLLIVPKKHVASLMEIGDEHAGVLGNMMVVAKDLAVKYECGILPRFVKRNLTASPPGRSRFCMANARRMWHARCHSRQMDVISPQEVGTVMSTFGAAARPGDRKSLSC